MVGTIPHTPSRPPFTHAFGARAFELPRIEFFFVVGMEERREPDTVEDLRRRLQEVEEENALLRKELSMYRRLAVLEEEGEATGGDAHEGGDEEEGLSPSSNGTAGYVYKIVSPVGVDIGGTLAKVVCRASFPVSGDFDSPLLLTQIPPARATSSCFCFFCFCFCSCSISTLYI